MHRIAIACLAVVLTAACNGDDDASPTTPSVTIATTAPTTVAPSSTSVPATPPPTDPPSETTSATQAPTSPPPTEPPTTTNPGQDLEEARAAVAAAVVTSWEAFNRVLMNPSDTEAVSELRRVMTEEEARGIFDVFLESYIINNLAERTNESFPAYIEPYPETLIVDLAEGTAQMEFCFASTNRLVQIQPDGSEVLQDDRVAVVFGTDTFVLEAGEWIDSGGETIEVRDGESECPAR